MAETAVTDAPPEREPVLRHLVTGTVCDGIYCEECTLQWLLTGHLYYTVPAQE